LPRDTLTWLDPPGEELLNKYVLTIGTGNVSWLSVEDDNVVQMRMNKPGKDAKIIIRGVRIENPPAEFAWAWRWLLEDTKKDTKKDTESDTKKDTESDTKKNTRRDTKNNTRRDTKNNTRRNTKRKAPDDQAQNGLPSSKRAHVR
jgi:hypothetical protein